MYKKRNKNTKWAIEESKTNLNSAKNRTVLLSKVAKKITSVISEMANQISLKLM